MNIMGIFDTVKNAIGMGGNEQPNIMGAIQGLIGGQGGLDNLISKFSSKGLGDVVGSWVGTGQNQPVSPEQLQNVLGSENVSNMASKLGINSSELTGKLSSLLPEVIDKLTPDGKVPEGDVLNQGMDKLSGLFK